MTEFLLLVVLAVLLVRWRILSQRLAELKGQIESASRDQVRHQELAQLLRRIYQLEAAVAGIRAGGTGAAQEAPMPAATPEPMPEAVPEPKLEPKPAPAAPMELKPEPAIAPPPPLPVTIAAESAQPPLEPPPPAPVPPPRFLSGPPLQEPEPARPSRSSDEWEAMVGGNWLNKLGVFVLVIAIALFLNFSFTKMGPAGRSAVGLAISFALLIGGVILERRTRYVIFGRGLIGGGWAGLYLTTYAMQAMDAAKVISNPLLGGFLLLAVATGMVVHSLRYRVQALTGLAYATAFAALAITPVTALSVIALVPLAGSLAVIAYRFSWSGMALFGLVATYATCASKGDNGAPLWSAQTVFAAYWLVFEVYDLLRARRRSNLFGEPAMLPLNALGFAALSYAKWSAARPADTYLLAVGIAVAYLADTILRAWLRPPGSFAPESVTLERIFAGGYEGPITLAAVCSVVAAALKLHGQTVNVVLLGEAEALFLAGLVFRQDYPRRLANTLFGALGLKLLFADIPDAGTVRFAGRTLQDWTPPAALAALIFYVNRGLRQSGRIYGFAASALIALALGYEVPLRHLGVTWLGFGAVLFIFGWRFHRFDFRVQGYLTGALAIGAMSMHQVEIWAGTAALWPHAWVPLAVAAVVAYGAALCALRSGANRFNQTERVALEAVASAATAAALAALLWRTVPAVYLGPAWIALALLVLELGLRKWPADLRLHAHILAALGAGRVLFFLVLPFDPIGRADERIAIGCAAALAYAFAARLFAARPDQAPSRESRGAVNVASAVGSFFALTELWALLNPVAVAPAWALFALVLMEIGLLTSLPGVRAQGHAVAAAAFGRLFFANLDPAGYTYGISHRLLNLAVVIGAHYFEWWRQGRWCDRLREWERALRRPYLYTAAGLIAGLLYLELRPPFVAVGWALLALLLLVVGRYWKLFDLRLQSYALAAVTFTRALALELNPGQTFASTHERIAAGVLVIGCLFVAQLFVPRTQERPAEFGARLFYSLLATFLATAFLYQEVSGSMLTVAWGIEGAVLLGAGFPLRDRTLRLSGLALFLICMTKLFAYDLQKLETLYRIMSFFVLGVILLGVSWIYTRFRDRIHRYL